MKLYNQLKKNYNKYTINNTKHYRRLNNLTTNIKTSITFLQRCRKSGVIPYFIQDSMKSIINIFQIDGKIPPNIHSTIHSIIETFHTKILNALIQHKQNIKIKRKRIKNDNKDNNITLRRL